jgi:hypothetical protein
MMTLYAEWSYLASQLPQMTGRKAVMFARLLLQLVANVGVCGPLELTAGAPTLFSTSACRFFEDVLVRRMVWKQARGSDLQRNLKVLTRSTCLPCIAKTTPLEENTVSRNLTNAAANSDTRAAFFLALDYENGFGVTKDLARETELYKATAFAGITYVQNKLGDCYQTGAGILMDMTMAVKAYRQAADLGDATAYWNLALRYQVGSGIEGKDIWERTNILGDNI